MSDQDNELVPYTAPETKAEAFKRLGNARLNKALDAIESMSSLANPSLYEYSDDQITAIEKALEDSVKTLLRSLDTRGKVKRELL